MQFVKSAVLKKRSTVFQNSIGMTWVLSCTFEIGSCRHLLILRLICVTEKDHDENMSGSDHLPWPRALKSDPRNIHWNILTILQR